jgi:hypothetical protein
MSTTKTIRRTKAAFSTAASRVNAGPPAWQRAIDGFVLRHNSKPDLSDESVDVLEFMQLLEREVRKDVNASILKKVNNFSEKMRSHFARAIGVE